ncbi:MAG: hypothetical protein M1820_009995 [Bogoriella megaspora]|nr:MAG: hypothetical protein M1820_009995 [Bogoriella megaspora]
MGKGSRLIFILVPLGLTLATLVCLGLVWGAGWSHKTLQSFYFLKADTTQINLNPSSSNTFANALLQDFFNTHRDSGQLADYYQIDLTSYCTGKEGKSIDFCSKPVSNFWFDPTKVWGLDSGLEQLFPKEFHDGLKTYQTVAHWMFVAYMVAFWLTVGELVIGLFATFSRIISLLTSLVAGVASVFVFAASLTATILYSTLLGTINTALKPYNIKGNLGKSMYATTWLAVAFSLAAGFFWLFSICCCSPHSQGRKEGKGRWPKRGRMGTGLMAERTPYTYERVESPFVANREPAAHEMTPLETGQTGHAGAYEPYRHV